MTKSILGGLWRWTTTVWKKIQDNRPDPALKLSVTHTTVLSRLHALGKVQKDGKWVPHKLSEINISQRLNTCVFLSAKHKKKSFLWKIVTGDEKWIYYDNPVNKKQWLSSDQAPLQSPKPEIHRKKVMLCVWWDQKGIIYWKLLEPKQTVTVNVYSQHLMRLSQALETKRPFVGKVSARSFWCMTMQGHMLQKQLRLR